jgi:hypothetical protein
MLRKNLRFGWEEITGRIRSYIMENFEDLHFSSDIIKVMRLTGHATCMEEIR